MHRSPRRTIPFLLLLIALAAPGRARAESAPVFLDGTFGDWTGPVEHTDPAGDGGSDVDFREVDLANDADWLFVRFQTTVDVGIQAEGNGLELYLDTDLNAATGIAMGGIGAELRWNFGARNGCFAPTGSCVTVAQDDLRLRMLPSVTGNQFEIAIARSVLPNGTHPLFTGASFRLVLRSALRTNGDLAPDAGGLLYTFDAAAVPPPAVQPFARTEPADVRIVTWNMPRIESGISYSGSVAACADRVLSAIDPDVLCFQELYNTTAAQVDALIEGFLPGRAPWFTAKHADCAVASRFPVLQTWTLDGNLAVLLDASTALDGSDLLLVCAHLPCCQNETSRQNEADRIMAFFRDAMTPGGVVTVPAGTAFAIAGDLNLVGFRQQLETLLEGDIVNSGTFGADFAPDWDGTALADAIAPQTERRFAYTWRRDDSEFAPGRLDFVIYNDSVLRLRHRFAVYSPEMSAAERTATGIQAMDVTTVSDHLPLVADFRATSDLAGVEPGTSGDVALHPRAAVSGGAVAFTLELAREAAVEVAIHDASGRRIRTLARGTLHVAGRHPRTWDGRDENGAPVPSGIYFARARARFAGGGERRATARWVLVR